MIGVTPIPLRDPSGHVYAYACGGCRRVASGVAGGEGFDAAHVAEHAERSRERAAQCCAGPERDEVADTSRAGRGAREERPAGRPASGAELAKRFGFRPMSEAEWIENVRRESLRAARKTGDG